MQFEMTDGARYLLNALNAAGYEAYLVGGCVRDLIRGVPPHDWDVCTSALPAQVADCFRDCRIIETGLKHGTITVVCGGASYEVTTYRTDGVSSDGRRPDQVRFVSNLYDDLSRRDFTINAIAMDSAGALYDPFCGAADIAAGVIQCVGEPDRRFREDGLRIMRALRFASVFGFSIEKLTSDGIHRNKYMLCHIARERIQVELCKLLSGGGVGPILRQYADVLCEFWHELGDMVGFEQHNPWHCHNVWAHTVAAVEAAPGDTVLRLTMLLHDIGKPTCFSLDEHGVGHFYGHSAVSASLADEMLRRLKFDNDTRKQVVELVTHHDAPLAPSGKIVRRWLNKIGPARLMQLLDVKRADSMGQRRELAQERLQQLDAIQIKAEEVIAEKQCFSLKELAVNGRDLILSGVKPGPQIGAVLNFLMDQVINGTLSNERDILLKEINHNKEASD